MTNPKSRIANAVRASADLLVERESDPDTLFAAAELIEQANALLAKGVEKGLEVRAELFASEMIEQFGATVPQDGDEFMAFSVSPYSGHHNGLRPKSISYRRVGDEVVAAVVLGTALEGAPGRAHGGATAAVFDDLMGAMQRVVDQYGYTRTLDVTYRGPVPVDEVVEFSCRLTEATRRSFTFEAQAEHGSRIVATARGVFTSMEIAQFLGQ